MSTMKVGIFSIAGELRSISKQPIKQIYPQRGWIEQNPFDILNSIIKRIEGVVFIMELV